MPYVHPLAAYRQRHGMSLGALAELLEVAKPTVYRWERGLRRPSATKLALISARTGIRKRDLRPDLAAAFEADAGHPPFVPDEDGAQERQEMGRLANQPSEP